MLEPFGSQAIHSITGINNRFFATWEMPDKQIQFAKRPAINTDWDITDPTLSDFNTASTPQLHTHPQAISVFATWYSSDHGLGHPLH